MAKLTIPSSTAITGRSQGLARLPRKGLSLAGFGLGFALGENQRLLSDNETLTESQDSGFDLVLTPGLWRSEAAAKRKYVLY